MPRYSLRTLLILLAVGPIVLAWLWWGAWLISGGDLLLAIYIACFFIALAILCGYVLTGLVGAITDLFGISDQR